MTRINFWSRSLSRVELDQRAREARLRLEQLERLLRSRVAARPHRLRRPLFPLSVGQYGGGPQKSRGGRPLRDRRLSRLPIILETQTLEETPS